MPTTAACPPASASSPRGELLRDAHEAPSRAVIGLVGRQLDAALEHRIVDRGGTLARISPLRAAGR